MKYFKVIVILFIISNGIFGHKLKGKASWYGSKFHGNKTANGEKYNMYELTAAHKTLPFDTKVRVVNLKNKKSVIVRINDRGPFAKNRIIDLSYKAAKKIGIDKTGTARVKLFILNNSNYSKKKYNKNSNKKYNKNNYYVLVASFSSKKNAIRFKKKLKRYDFDPRIIKSNSYRVVLGGFKNKKDAKLKLKYLKYYKYKGYIINGSNLNK